MTETPSFRSAVGRLKQAMAEIKVKGDEEFINLIADQQSVLARFQPFFAQENINSLAEQEFRDFLLLKNNRHWTGLHRQGPKVCKDMDRLRAALTILVDESRPIEKRLDELRPKGKSPMVPGLSRAIITAILHIRNPTEYGVWNNTQIAAMATLGISPAFQPAASFGEKYVHINGLLKDLAQATGVDLWTLDALWWRIKQGVSPPVVDIEETGAMFGLEKHLQEFLVDNWDKTELGKDWALYEEDDEVVGVEYDTCEVGRIDLLAYHREKPCWLVIELKKNQSSDATVGQALRYMGWVQENRAKEGETVEGMIIAREADPKILYALRQTKNTTFRRYTVEFHLLPAAGTVDQ